MKITPLYPRLRQTRVFTALLISFMLLATPVAPLAAPSSAALRAAGGAFAPASAVISATKTDSFPDANGDGKAELGETITYDVQVSNTGASDATGVAFTDTIDPNTTFVPGSLKVSPLAFADSYNATKEIALSIPAPGVLGNDTGTPAPSAQPIAAGATAQGGTVTLNADGSFNYTPPAGFEGADSFSYTATNGTTPNDSATVTINVDAGPAVTATTPANGATGAAPNTNITVTFTEPVNATTGSFSVECPSGSPQPFTLSASPSATFTLDPSADLPAGTTCTVTVFAAGITDADSFDPPDQMAADYTFSFGVKPLAVDDMRSATGNVRINTAVTGYSVLANDQGAGATITAFDATSAHGGQVTMNTGTGTFTYNPPAGFTGTDSFNYTIGNAAGSDQGTVVLTVSDMLWFINSAPGACSSGCDGRLTNPFTSLTAFEAVNGNGTTNLGVVVDPEAGDHIFIYTGSGDYAGPLTLENSQRVIGQGATSDIPTLAFITPAPDSDALPSTGGVAPSITSGGNGIVLAANNHLYGLAFSDTAGAAVSDVADVGTLVIGDVSIDNTGTGGPGIVLDDGGTSFTTTGTNSIATATGTALSVTGTNIGAAGITFRSISSDGGGAGTSGIVLNNTGADGGLTVAGNGGTCSTAADCSGGAILNKGVAVSLTNTQDVSLNRMFIQNTTSSGIGGTQVTNFTLADSVVDSTGTSATLDNANSALFFGTQTTGTERNLSGTVQITGNTLTNMFMHGVSIVNYQGTITSADISNNVITSPTTTATSKGTGIQISALGTASLAAAITTATINQNTISNFPSNAGMQVLCGNTVPPPGPSVTCGAGAASAINITNNTISGQSAAVRIGTQGILANYSGSSTGHLNIDGNTVSNVTGNAVSHSVTGLSNVTTVINDNTITANNSFAAQGISVGTSFTSGFVPSAPVLSVKITNNNVSQTDGVGINAVARDNATGTLNITVRDNTVAAPLTGVRQGIVVIAGATTAGDNDVCLDIAGNTSAGSGGATGIGLRKQGTSPTVNAFGIEGMAATASPGVQAYVNSQNPAGGGTTLISATSGFTSCSSAPDVASLGGDAQDATALFAQASVTAEARTWSDMPDRRETAASGDGDTSAAFNGARIVRASYERPAARTSAGAGDRATVYAAASAPVAALVSGETVTANVGTLPAGKSVRITFQVTVNNPFTGSQQQVSNQGTVTADGGISVLTDDPAAGGLNDPTVTPVLAPPSVSVKDASVAEPATGSATAAFAVTLSHAFSQAVTVDFATAADTGGANPATAGSDYSPTSGTLTFSPGQTVQTISVPVLSDADAAETAETFLVDISNATAGSTIADAQAVGTITPESTPGTVVISELRTSGPGGPDDDFVELLNNTDADIVVQASDASAGWALVKSGNDCSATPVVVAVIPNGTVIPARGNYLVTGSAYSLGAYAAGDQALVLDIENDRNVALFDTSELSNVSTVTRLDAVGFGFNSGNNCDLLREGATLQPAAGSTSEYSFVRKVEKGRTQDTNDNASDFVVVSTTPATSVGGNSPVLGAPGPENSTGARGPVPCSQPPGATSFDRQRLDSTVAVGSAPNTVRDATSDPVNNSNLGTIDFRRRFTNNTGAPVTQLRFRITNRTDPSAPGAADLRARTSAALVVGGVNDPATCGGPAPCNATVLGTTLEQPPAQALGGGVNSTLRVVLGTPLNDGDSVNLHLLFGVQQAGNYHVSIVVEAQTGGQIGQDVWELRGHTDNGGHSDGGCNTPPVADAGADQTIECGGASTPVSLDGSLSSDADGDPLTYEWREGATVLGTDATLNTSLPFGPHTITLKVTDPTGDFSEDTVSVNVVDTAAPMITAPGNVSVSTGPGATSCDTFVSDEALGEASASDGCSASVTITRTGVPSGNVFPVGTTKITYTADDGHGHTTEAYQFVTVTDDTPPTVNAPANIEVNAPPNSCSVSLDPGTATASDNCPGVTVAGVRSDAQPLNAPYPVGTTTITWTATDAHSNTASAIQTVKVKDVTAPTITLTTGAINLSPPNHQYQTFSIANFVASVSDSCDASVDINDVVISQATSDEPENASGNGDGNTVNDIVIAPDCKSLQLRSEREGGGNGRVYTITLQVKDSSGNVATAVRKVFVPRSGPAVDGPVQYAVNGCLP